LEALALLAGEPFGASFVSSFGGSLSTAVPPLLPEVVWGWSKSLPDHVAFLGQARQGLFVLVQHLLAQRPSRVFVLPAYTCPSVTQAVEQAGGTCVFVDVDHALDFDWADLKEQLLALDPADCVLVPTSLFGAPVRDYKRLFPKAVVVEDRSQSSYDESRRADFQILSFGPGKLLSVGGGGALVAQVQLPPVFHALPAQSVVHFAVAMCRTLAQDVIFKRPWLYQFVAPLLPRLLRNSGHHDTIHSKRLHLWHARWAWYAMCRMVPSERQRTGQAWLQALPKGVVFNVTPGTTWLRLPVQTKPVSAAFMSETSRQRVLPGAQRLVACTLLPVHSAVPHAWLVSVASVITMVRGQTPDHSVSDPAH
jgi:hypothetical protein